MHFHPRWDSPLRRAESVPFRAAGELPAVLRASLVRARMRAGYYQSDEAVERLAGRLLEAGEELGLR